jgi:hypothetical protein
MDATPKLDFGAGDYRVMTIEIKAAAGALDRRGAWPVCLHYQSE